MSSLLSKTLRTLDRLAFSQSLGIYGSLLNKELAENWQSLLDIGCGSRSPLDPLTAQIPLTVGIESYEPSIAQARSQGAYTRYELVHALDAARHFGGKSFDIVFALDVIEHFPKDEGYRLLQVMEAVARHRVVVFTPNGFLPQGKLDGNPYQEHQSGWTVDDFEARGYRVVGVNGWRPLRTEGWQPRLQPAALGHRISAASQPLVTRRPRHAFQLLACLDIPEP